ncbi:type II toxin-antitoxin system Phd/YefM family antitoxin [Roseofilum sp. Guam]|uniref:type II toxin-antitoxin system Phd/YefM family antitoxin n=1 Tax=Roseofilum sp. Guam TaxID=2821502 RepID=UPI001B2A07D2|nr:type II toxin-antitoxin system Phd/YefM family antitoxin [Roseofilum sp. Guam]MBP0030016.1 type II toxin-antitoxin system Phd/YefM family antitoxin [Roseofilum sp. Guam]
MLNLSRTRSLDQVQEAVPAILDELKTDKTPIVITIDGKAAAVLQDAESYQNLLDKLESLETIVGIRKSLEEFEQGQGISIRQAWEEFQQKYDLPS